MPRILLPKLRGKSRKHPIKRDEFGRSARQRAFAAFDQGYRPSEVAHMVGISPRTAHRYFADWKKLPQNIGIRYRIARAALKKHEGFSETTIKTLAGYLDMPEEELIVRLEKPWGLKQLLMAKWPNYSNEKIKSEREARLRAALELIALVERAGMTPEEITAAIDTLIKEAARRKVE